ncbi:MAG TPA: HAMP domain-containing sensor histidine kinase [Solirubrobacteraceae bacterium]|nr:HAMP domain-containing sensor histidine kinase [Solirubrobacteraceae bacterium]
MRRLRAWIARHGSVRLRLALLYAGMFLLLGTVLIAVIYAVGDTAPVVQVTAHAKRTLLTPYGAFSVVASPSSLVLAQHAADNVRLLGISWISLLITALISVPLGWFVSGWMLRPVRDITARARTISAGNLHERLALAGPRDEFTELGDTLDDLLARLEAAFDAQRRFVANASHELRTPLTLERTLLQLALADPNATAETLRATCEELLASGREQEQLIEALLTLASSERGLVVREPVDLRALAAGVLSSPRAEVEALRLTVTSTLEPARTDGDAALIERLIANLVDNAVTHNVANGQVHVSTGTRDGQAVLTVRNSGQTIEPDEIETMFEPFRRLGAPRTGSDTRHHGLGLSIVRAIAAAHGASVDARPGADGGLVISIAFAAS